MTRLLIPAFTEEKLLYPPLGPSHRFTIQNQDTYNG